MSETNYSVTNALVDIFAAPGKALEQVKSHAAWLWWPLLISLLLTLALTVYYNSWVDMEWLIENEIQKIPAESRAESADAVRAFMNSGAQIWISVVSVVIFSFLVYVISATWFHLANKLTSGAPIRWGQWFGFSVWTMFPLVIGAFAAFAVIFMADSNQLPAEKMQALSLNQIFIHAGPGEPWFNWGNAFSILNFWVIALMSIGYARWTGSSTVKSAVIAALPWVLVFGIWAATV